MNQEPHSRKTIAIVASSTTSGGAEKYLIDLYLKLSEKFDFKVKLIGQIPNWPTELGEISQIGRPFKFTRQTSIFLQILRSLSYPFRVHKAVKLLNPDLIHMQYMREKLLLPFLLSKIAPILWTEHGPLPSDLGRVPLALYKFQSKKSNIIAISAGVQASLKTHNVKSTLIRNPFPDVDSAVPKLIKNQSVSTCHFIYLGRLHEYKRIHLILEAAFRLPEVDFSIAGDGPFENYLRSLAPLNVNFLGYINDINSLLLSSTGLILPSGLKAREGSPLAMLQARALGVPVLAAADSHAAQEAEELGCTIFQPDADSLVESLNIVMNGPKTIPVGPIISAERSTISWVQLHFQTIEQMLKP